MKLILLGFVILISFQAVEARKKHRRSSSSSSSSSGSEAASYKYFTEKPDTKVHVKGGAFKKLRQDSDLVSIIKSKGGKHSHHKDDSFSLSKSGHSHHHKKSKSSSKVKFSSRSAVQQSSLENSYICNSRAQRPKIPGGPQKIGFTHSYTWQRKAEDKRRKKRKGNKAPVTSETNGVDPKFIKETSGVVKDPVDAGWWMISFGAGKSDSSTSFKFKTKRPLTVSLVDLFCQGDSFAVLDDGILIAQSSRVKPDRDCKKLAFSPQQALEDGRWASVVFELPAGRHEIVIRTVDSPFEGGVAGIRFETTSNTYGDEPGSSDESSSESVSDSSSSTDSDASSSSSDAKPVRRSFSRKQVCSGYNGFLVITTPFAKENAGKACTSIKAQLADLDGSSAVLPAAIKSVYRCSGADMAWVDAYDHDGIADLVLKVQKGGKKGALTQPSGKHPVLCQIIK